MNHNAKMHFSVLAMASVLSFGLSAQAKEEVKIACGIAPYENVFKRIQPKFEAETGTKMVFTGTIDKNGADISMKALLAGEADVASAAVQWADWQKIGTDKGIPKPDVDSLAQRVIGRDMMKVIAHPAAAPDKLTMAQVEKVFSGEVKNWKEVGGKDQAIVLVLQNTYPATNAAFKKMALKTKDFASTAVFGDSVAKMMEKVAATPGGLGFVSALADAGTAKIVKTDEPIGRPVTALTKGKPSAKVQKLYDIIAKEMK